MTDSELIEQLHKELKKKEQLKSFIGEVIATLLLNFNKGNILAITSKATQDFGIIIAGWDKKFKEIEGKT